MAFVHADRVKEISTTTGTGVLALAGATAGFRSWAAGVGVGNESFYGIVHTLDNTWEVGRGTVGAGTFSRDTVFSSSNSNLLVNFAAGDKIIFTTNPAFFYTNALDAAAHSLLDHTLAPLNLLDAAAHSGVDHTAAPLNLLNVTGHEAVDHTLAPFSLLDATGHQGIDHTIAPFNLLDATGHNSIDHTTAPLSLLAQAAHLVLDHSTIPGVGETNPTQVTPTERTAGTEVNLRSFSPFDVATMAGIFGGGGGSGKLVGMAFDDNATQSSNAPGTVTPTNNNARLVSEMRTQICSVTYTPQSLSNSLVIFGTANLSASGNSGYQALGIEISTSPTLLAYSYAVCALPGQDVYVSRAIAVSATSPTTFRLWGGETFGNSLQIGYGNGIPLNGAANRNTLVVMEIAP